MTALRTRVWVSAGIAALLLSTLLVVRSSSASFVATTSSSGNTAAADELVPPGTPTASYSCSLTARRITVSWTASPSSWTTDYQVYRSVNGGSWSSRGTVAYGTNSWTDTNVSGSTSYAYRLRGERSGWSWVSDDTAPSNTVSTPGLCL